MRSLNQAGLSLIKQFEGLKLKSYLDSVGVATIGYGTTHYPSGVHVAMTDPAITEAQASIYLQHDLFTAEDAVCRLVTHPLSDNQYGALVSFTYNLGQGSLASSTLLKKVNLGDMVGAADEFLKWDRAGGQVSAGLLRRREAERTLFLTP